jgi:hypothetical protein
LLSALIGIVICGRSRRTSVSLHVKVPAIANSLFFAMTPPLILQANFWAPRIKNNGDPQTCKRIRSGPDAEIDERARSGGRRQGRKAFGQNEFEFRE